MNVRNLNGVKHHRSRWPVALGLLILLSLFVAGCSVTSRHKFLTVVFTGVPPLEQESDSAEPAEQPLTPQEKQLLKQQQFQAALMPTFWAHGPFSAGQCHRCHNVAQSKNFQGSSPEIGSDPFTSGTAVFGSRLAVPKEQLCISCHSSHGSKYANEHGLRQHVPSQQGNCTACHHPHQARRRFMLLGESNDQLCLGCHKAGSAEIGLDHVSSQSESCSNCHNPHVGSKKALLKADDDELHLLYELLPGQVIGKADAD